jgi:hypothetical protein
VLREEREREEKKGSSNDVGTVRLHLVDPRQSHAGATEWSRHPPVMKGRYQQYSHLMKCLDNASVEFKAYTSKACFVLSKIEIVPLGL